MALYKELRNSGDGCFYLQMFLDRLFKLRLTNIIISHFSDKEVYWHRPFMERFEE